MKFHRLLVFVSVMLLAAGACQKQVPQTVPESVTIITEPLAAGESSAGGQRPITIAASSDWTAVSNQGWIYVTPSSGGKGIQEVTIHFDPNTTGKRREGSITFTSGTYSESYTLTQKK
jgi:hypothetical protein